MKPFSVENAKNIINSIPIIPDYCIPLHKTQVRGLRHEALVEYKRIFDLLYPIERDFLASIQQSETNDFTYREIYAFHLKQYEDACKWLNRNLKAPRHLLINTDYFHVSYKPREVESQRSNAIGILLKLMPNVIKRTSY